MNISNTDAISFFKIDVYPLQKIIKWFKSVHTYHGTLGLKTPHPATESPCAAATWTNRVINYIVKKVTFVSWPFIVNINWRLNLKSISYWFIQFETVTSVLSKFQLKKGRLDWGPKNVLKLLPVENADYQGNDQPTGSRLPPTKRGR